MVSGTDSTKGMLEEEMVHICVGIQTEVMYIQDGLG